MRAGKAQETNDETVAVAPKASTGEAVSPKEAQGPISAFWNDPTLDGKLHLTYRARYTAKVFDFKKYEFPFSGPGQISSADREQARLLEERHKDTSDQDLDQYFALRVENLYPVKDSKALQAVSGEASCRYFKDLDGSPGGEEARDGFDHFAHRQDFQLQTLLARAETFDRHLQLAFGRQFGYEAEWLHFDGATAIFRGLKVLEREVELSAFGGSRVTFYPRSASSLDGIEGGHVKVWLAEKTRLKLTDVYYVDNSFQAEIRQDLSSASWVLLQYRQINEDPHSVVLEGTAQWLEKAFTLYFLYVGKLGRNADDFNFDFTQSARRSRDGDKDRFFNIGDIEPYDEGTLELRKELGGWFGLFGGGTLHYLRERDRRNNYNTDWQEAWVGFDLHEPLWKGLTGRATARYVHTDLPRRLIRLKADDVIQNGVPDFKPEDLTGDGEPGFFGLELLLEQDFARKVAVGGTAVFRSYDYQSNYVELQDLKAASLGVYARYRMTAATQWLLSYSYDRDYQFLNPDFDSLHTVRLEFVLEW
jgi:hypothetical protein